jgi:tripeptidyl-peptidase-1
MVQLRDTADRLALHFSRVAASPLSGETSCLVSGKVFSPSWPCNCPWVTNVGATMVTQGRSVNDPESAALLSYPGESASSSGGGFSNIYRRPSYQKETVSKYFAEHNPPYSHYDGLVGNSTDVYAKPHIAALVGSSGGRYNRIGRAIPDVSANGLNGAIAAEGEVMPDRGGGTSMSAPIFAAIVSLTVARPLLVQRLSTRYR